MYNFIEILSDFVKVGQEFEVSGILTATAEFLTISFSSGTLIGAESVLFIDVNFTDNKIIINKEIEKDVAVELGTKFEFRILAEKDYFRVTLNGDFVCESKYDIPPEKIRSVIIYGDIEKLTKVNHLDAAHPCIVNDDENLAFESFIPIKYQPGHVVTILGTCSEEFYLMFNKNGTNRQLLHFNVRFDEGVALINTEDDVECWSENEERSIEFPFEIEKTFKIAFAFTPEDVKVAVNGSPLMGYNISRICLEEDESLWSIMSGFRIKNREADTVTAITAVEHFQVDSDCNGFEQYSTLE